MGEFRMPSLGADMDAGTIVEWRVRPGDEVHRGDIVAVVDTDKADIDAEVFEDGVIGELLVGEGEKVPVGTVLATIVASAHEQPAPVPAPPPAPEPATAAAPEPVRAAALPVHHHKVVTTSPLVRHLAERVGVEPAAVRGTGPGGTVTRTDVENAAHREQQPRQRVSPRARRLALETGIDLAGVRGSGPDGAVIGADIAGASEARPAMPRAEPAEQPARRDRVQTMRARTATLMERANREIPHYWVTRDLDLSRASAWLVTRNAARPPAERIVPAALLLVATARAAAAHPNFNGRWTAERFDPAGTVDLGLVVTLRGGGLIVPVIQGAETLTASALMARMHDLVTRARSGHLRSSDVADPSITVSNLGDQGGDAVLGVIYPPQVALIGFGRVRERPWAENGMLGVRPIVTASVAGDHRVSEGHEASTFLTTVAAGLDDPSTLEETET
jgi:pyruvate dehydrogenase E2 component (dihydrolipoamide acetyltransferase)